MNNMASSLDYKISFIKEIVSKSQFSSIIRLNRQATITVGNLGYTYIIEVDISNIIQK